MITKGVPCRSAPGAQCCQHYEAESIPSALLWFPGQDAIDFLTIIYVGIIMSSQRLAYLLQEVCIASIPRRLSSSPAFSVPGSQSLLNT